MLTGPALILSAAFLVVSLGSPPPTAAQTPVLELDHVYVVVAPGGAAAIQALRRVGIIVDSFVARHDGQGTASRGAFFDNAYLELLWVDSSVAVDSLHRVDHVDFLRAAAWRQSGASPFGIGLHFLTGTASALTVPARLDSAPWLRPGTYYILLRQPQESLAAEMFIMPADRAVTSWLERFRSRRPDLFSHALGGRRITGIIVRGSSHQRPRAADLDTRLVRFEEASSPALVIEFDGGHFGQTWDLRPALPLILRR